MKKFLVLLLAALLACGALCGCGTKQNPDDEDYNEDGYAGDDYDGEDYDGDDYNGDDYAGDDYNGDDYYGEDDDEDDYVYTPLDIDATYFFTLNYYTYYVGDPVSELSKDGYKLLNENNTLEPMEHSSGSIAPEEEQFAKFYVWVYNTTEKTITYGDSVIGGFQIRAGSVEDNEVLKNIEVYGGIKLGSSVEEVKEAFGEPTSIVDSLYAYRSSDSDRYYKFSFDADRKVEKIEWANYAFDKDDAEEESNNDNKKENKNDGKKMGTQDKSLLKQYLGLWKYETEDVRIALEADFTWSMYDYTTGEKKRINSGTFTLDEERVYLFDKEEEFVTSLESITSNIHSQIFCTDRRVVVSENHGSFF